MAEFYLKHPDGSTYLVPEEKVQEAYAAGYRRETPEESTARAKETVYGGAGGVAKATLAGAARGLTMGLSDVALRATGAASPETLEGLKEENPIASGVGEFGAGVAGTFLLPFSAPARAAKLGAGVVKALAPEGAGLLARTGARLVGGAVEGGLFGTSQMVTEAAISKDPELTAQKVFGTIGASALTGGLLAAGAGVLGDTATGAYDYMRGKEARGWLRGLRNERTLRALGMTPSQYEAMPNPEVSTEILGSLDREIFPRAFSHVKTVEKNVDKLMATRGKDLEESLIAAEAKAGGTGDEIRQKVSEYNEALRQSQLGMATPKRAAELGLGFDMDQAIDKMRAAAGEAASDPVLQPLMANVNALAERYAKKAAEGVSFREAAAFKTELQNMVGNFIDTPIAKTALRQMSTALKQNIDDQLLPHLGEQGLARYQADRNFYEALVAAKESVTSAVARRMVGAQADVVPGMVIGTGGIPGMAKSALYRGVRPFINPMLAHALGEGGPSSGIMANAVKRFMDAGLSTNTFGGAFRQILERASAQGASDTLATHVHLSETFGDEYHKAIGVDDSTDPTGNRTAQRLMQLQQIKAAEDAQNAAIDTGIGRMLGTQGGRAPSAPVRTMTHEEYAKLAKHLEALRADPVKMQAALDAGKLGTVAPDIAGQMGITGSNALALLASTMPRPPKVEPVAALTDDWRPGVTDRLRWSRYLDAVQNPMRILSDLKEGTVTQEQVHALEAVYPALLGDVQRRLLERLSQHPGKLPYKQRYALSVLFKAPMGGAGDAQRLQLIQQAHKASMQPMQAPDQSFGAGGAGGGDGRQKVDVEKNLETQAQRIEARGQ